MHAAGDAFYKAANGVWLTDHVPPATCRADPLRQDLDVPVRSMHADALPILDQPGRVLHADDRWQAVFSSSYGEVVVQTPPDRS